MVELIRIAAFFILFVLMLILIVLAVAAPVGIVWHSITDSLRLLLLFIGYPFLLGAIYGLYQLLDMV